MAKLEHKDWHYTIIDDGNQKNSLKRLAKKLKIEEKIEFTGKIKRIDVLNKLKESNIFIMLSREETFGMAYLEAMSKANIVIASKDDGIDGIIKNNLNGFTIPVNKNQLASTIKEITAMPNENLRHILLNTKKTVNLYDSENAAYNYIENIKKAIKMHMLQS